MGRIALVMHLVAAVAAVGASIHAALFAHRGAQGRARRLVLIGFVASLAATALGALLYPDYKLSVRLAYLEQAAPGAARLFDLKEQLVALALALQAAAVLVSRAEPAEPAQTAHTPESARPLLRGLTLSAACLLSAGALLAAWVVTVHAWR